MSSWPPEAPAPASGGTLLLMPGALSFVAAGWRLRTLLGSCVSVVVWHARLQVGGMCHYLLARRTGAVLRVPPSQADGRFGEEALDMLARQMALSGQPSSTFVAHVAGGAQCFSGGQGAGPHDIGAQNVALALDWCQAMGLPVLSCRTGGRAARHLLFDPADGRVQVRQTQPIDGFSPEGVSLRHPSSPQPKAARPIAEDMA